MAGMSAVHCDRESPCWECQQSIMVGESRWQEFQQSIMAGSHNGRNASPWSYHIYSQETETDVGIQLIFSSLFSPRTLIILFFPVKTSLETLGDQRSAQVDNEDELSLIIVSG